MPAFMDALTIADHLASFAIEEGWSPPERVYIRGVIRCTTAEGDHLYSDEAMDWCEPCAKHLVRQFLDSFVGPLEDPPEVELADPSCPNDTSAACDGCGETLDHCLSDVGVAEEVRHYIEHPIAGGIVNRRQAFELSCLIVSAPDDPEVLAIGLAALAAIKGPDR